MAASAPFHRGRKSETSPHLDIIASAGSEEEDTKYAGKRRSCSHQQQAKTTIAIISLFATCLFIFVAIRRGSDKQIGPSQPNGNLDNIEGKVLSPRPDGWETWSWSTFRKKLQCQKYLRGTAPLPTLEYWQTLRDAYRREVDPSMPFDDPIPPTRGYTLNAASGEGPPYVAKLSPGKGRGLFASRDIRRGELVDGIEGGTRSDVIFPDLDAMRRYLLALPRGMACDVTEWSYAQRLTKGGPTLLMTATDISILMNTAAESKDVNVGPKDGTSSVVLYATRDITKGEEILMDYDVFPTGEIEEWFD
ncbi:hypothetical protein ACHAXT_002956 [Thalassiosira profunda]